MREKNGAKNKAGRSHNEERALKTRRFRAHLDVHGCDAAGSRAALELTRAASSGIATLGLLQSVKSVCSRSAKTSSAKQKQMVAIESNGGEGELENKHDEYWLGQAALCRQQQERKIRDQWCMVSLSMTMWRQLVHCEGPIEISHRNWGRLRRRK